MLGWCWGDLLWLRWFGIGLITADCFYGVVLPGVGRCFYLVVILRCGVFAYWWLVVGIYCLGFSMLMLYCCLRVWCLVIIGFAAVQTVWVIVV